MDTDGDGLIDSVAMDADGDGSIDSIALDTNNIMMANSTP